MNPQIVEEEIARYQELVRAVTSETHWGDNEDSPTHYFGCKTQRKMKDCDELFTIPDWGNIEKFIRHSLQTSYQQGVKDAIASLPEKMITPDENIFNHPTLSAYDNGFNSAIDQVKEALEKLMNKRREG